MKQEDMLAHVKAVYEKRAKIFQERNEAYADVENENGLSNFHDTAAICRVLGIDIKASEVGILLAVLKQVRDAQQKKLGKDSRSEVRADNISDQHNYLDLSIMCELEERDNIPLDFSKVGELQEKSSDVFSGSGGSEHIH